MSANCLYCINIKQWINIFSTFRHGITPANLAKKYKSKPETCAELFKRVYRLLYSSLILMEWALRGGSWSLLSELRPEHHSRVLRLHSRGNTNTKNTNVHKCKYTNAEHHSYAADAYSGTGKGKKMLFLLNLESYHCKYILPHFSKVCLPAYIIYYILYIITFNAFPIFGECTKGWPLFGE